MICPAGSGRASPPHVMPLAQDTLGDLKNAIENSAHESKDHDACVHLRVITRIHAVHDEVAQSRRGCEELCDHEQSHGGSQGGFEGSQDPASALPAADPVPAPPPAQAVSRIARIRTEQHRKRM